MKKIPVILIALNISVFSCDDAKESASEKLAESIIETATDQDVDIDTEDGSAKIKMKTEDGEATYEVNSKEIPADFPENVYTIEGEVMGGSSIEQGDKKIVSCSFKTTDSMDKLANEIKDNMKDSWELKIESTQKLMTMLNFVHKNDDKVVANYSIMYDNSSKGHMVTVMTTR